MLTAWNALMIRALADASAALQRRRISNRPLQQHLFMRKYFKAGPFFVPYV
ncbi:MAG: hypothetical protein U0T81_14385 [Saprospiraceae bacterium]